MKILVAGAGAMGARFGYMLKNAGNDVTFADKWTAHVEKINTAGLSVKTDAGTELVHIPAFFPQDITGTFDIVLVFTKTLQLKAMMEDLKHILTPETKIVCLLNGLGNIEVLEQFVAKTNIFVGTTIWSAELHGPASVELTGSGSIEIQQVEQTTTTATETIINCLNGAKLNAHPSNNVLQTIWHKVGFNCVLNTYCALLDCNVGQFGSYDNVTYLIDAVLNEVTAVGLAENIAIEKDAIRNNILKQFDPQASGDHYPSMHQDLYNHRFTEIDYLNGMIATLGKKHQIETPVCALLTQMIHAKETMFGAK
jgi:2-dehydropantoate 2-reductase